MHHDEDDLDATVIRPRGPGGHGSPVDAAGQVGPGGAVGTVRPARSDEVDDPFGDTVLRDPAQGSTSLGAPTGQPVPGEPGLGRVAPVVPPAPVVRPDHVPSIRVGSRVVRLDRPVVVGRRPGLPRVVRGPTPELLTVPSPTGQVSASHLLVHAAGETAVVDDLHSTNGTVIRPPGGTPLRMASGTSNVVLTGTVVEIGDGNTIEILSPFTRLTPPGPAPTGPSRTPRERS